MFYSQFILAKKGPLGTIWIAAHLERKLRKNQVAETDIGVTVDNILFPEVPIALRLSGHLLLGVVRIYSRQVNYLFNDCSETLGKIKQAFHSAAVDLPPEATTAPFHTITLPETFDFDELELGPDPENAFLYSKGKFVDHHVTTREQITLQDSIQNNPYLGSSQFGLDERFGDGSYSSLGLDFDEEFWASKAGTSSIASTSTPLLKEDTVLPPAGGETEVRHMDVDDPYEQPRESDVQRSMAVREAVDTDSHQIETDNQLNSSVPACSSALLNEPCGFETALRKDSNLAALKNDAPSFHAYTPRVLEACTPDLNREYCPPAEPSTPALADETSLPMYKECTAKTAGNFPPATLGVTERGSSGLLPASSAPQQIFGMSTLVSSSQATISLSPASFQGFPSPASFQGLPLPQAASVGTNREAFVTQKGKGQAFSIEENASSASASFQGLPQITLRQQNGTPVSHEGAVFPTGTTSFSIAPESSLSSLRQQDGNPSITGNHHLAGTGHQELYPRFQNEVLAVGSQNPMPSSAAMVELAGTINQKVDERVQQQGLAVSAQNSVPSLGAMIGSGGNVNYGIHEGSPQQGVAGGLENPMSLLESRAGSAGTPNQGTYPSFQENGLAVSLQNPVSSLPSFGAMAGAAGSLDHGDHVNFQQQDLAISSANQVSLPGAVAGSVAAVYQENAQQQGLSVASSNPVSSSPSFRAVGLARTLDHEVRVSSQQQGLAVASPNPVSSLPSSGAMGLVGSVDHGVCVSSPNQGVTVASLNQQGHAAVSPSPVSSLPSSGAMGLVGSEDHGVCVSSQNQGVTVASQNQQGLAAASPSPVSSLPSLGATGLAKTVDHGVHVSSQQQGPAVGSPNPVASSGAMAGSAGIGKHGTDQSFQQQGFAVASQNPMSSLASAMIGAAGSVDHGVHASPQLQALAVGAVNPVSLFGTVAGSAGTNSQGTHSSFQQKPFPVASPPVSSLSLAMATPAGTADHEVHSSPHHQEGPVAGSRSPLSSFGAMAGTGSQGAHTNFQQQGFAVTSANSVGSVSSLGVMDGSTGTADRGVYASSQQKGLAVSVTNPMSLSGAMAGLAGTGSQGVPSFQQRGLAAAPPNAVSSLSSFETMARSAGTVDLGAHASSQQEGLAIGSPNALPSFGAIAGSADTRSQGYQPSFQQQGLAAASLNPVSSLSSFGHMVGLSGTGSQEVHGSSQKQGPAVSSVNRASSFGAVASSAETGNQGTYSSYQQQSPAVALVNQMPSSSSFGAMVGSAGSGNHGVQVFPHQQGFAAGSQNPVSSFGAMAGSENHGVHLFSHQQGFAAGSQNPVSSFGAMAGTVNQEAYPNFHQQSPAVRPQNPVSSFGAVVESTVSSTPSTMRNMGPSQVLASPFMTEAGNMPLFSPSSGSLLPVTNPLPAGHMKSTKSNKVNAHETLDSAGFKDVLRPSVTQQVSLSSPTVRPGVLPSMRLGECENLRSTYDLQSGSPGYLMMQKDLSVERIPSLEVERNRSFSVSTGGFTKGLPAMDMIPSWREETPYSFTRQPFLPAPTTNSLPADDDVLASILGRRTRDFKVVATPKDPKEPKVNVAKRPKRAPRITPKKRKIEIDTVAVLHGDVIRQQLANAEDIRRDRRKAPCTRREVWAFIRECEGQENFDEPTLPEISQDLHDLYHDVLHGREARPSVSAPNGAVIVNQPSESQPVRTGEIDFVVPGVNKDANALGPRSESNHELCHTIEDVNRDLSIDKFDGQKNNSSERLTGQLNESAKIEIIRTNAFVSSIEAENPENPIADMFLRPEAGFEGLARKERDGIASSKVQHLEISNPGSRISSETEANEQAKQSMNSDRENETLFPTQREILVSSLSENMVGIRGAEEDLAMTKQKDVLGIVGRDGGTQESTMTMQKNILGVVSGDVGIQERAMTMQHDAERLEEKQLGIVGRDGGTQESPMTMQKNILGVVSGDVGIQERAMTMQHDAERLEEKQLGIVGGDGGTQESAMTMQKNILGVVSGDVGIQERAMTMQHGEERLEEKQLGFGVLEHEATSIGKETDFKTFHLPSDSKDLTEVPMSNGKDVLEVSLLNTVNLDRGNMLGQTEVPVLDGNGAPKMSPFIVDVEKVPMSDGKDVFGVPEVRMSDGKDVFGVPEVPMSDGKEVFGVPPVIVVDIEKGNMEGRAEVPVSDGKAVYKVPLPNVVDIEKGNTEGMAELPVSDGNVFFNVPLLNVVDIEKGNMEGRTEVLMSDGKDVSEMPFSSVVDIEKGNMEGKTEVPITDENDVPGGSLLNIVDMDKGTMEVSDKLLDADKEIKEGIDNLPTSSVNENLMNAEKGSKQGFDNLPTSNGTEEETNCGKDDEERAAMECERDTDYLDDHDGDNDVAFAEFDYSSDEQDASIQDSNGWSARSRNVGRYLKTAFEEMEGNLKRSEQGPTLALERLLARKTKREAARMFFETLVLKTKDYIHVEQKVAYQDIHLFPRSKLMKTEF